MELNILIINKLLGARINILYQNSKVNRVNKEIQDKIGTFYSLKLYEGHSKVGARKDNDTERKTNERRLS